MQLQYHGLLQICRPLLQGTASGETSSQCSSRAAASQQVGVCVVALHAFLTTAPGQNAQLHLGATANHLSTLYACMLPFVQLWLCIITHEYRRTSCCDKIIHQHQLVSVQVLVSARPTCSSLKPASSQALKQQHS
jgi:hypothetical protein